MTGCFWLLRTLPFGDSKSQWPKILRNSNKHDPYFLIQEQKMKYNYRAHSVGSLGPVCLSFPVASQREKPEAQTNSELLVQLLESWKLTKAEFI